MARNLLFRKKCQTDRASSAKRPLFKLLLPLVALSLPSQAAQKMAGIRASELHQAYRSSRSAAIGAVENRDGGYLYSLVMPTSDKRRVVIGTFKRTKSSRFLIIESERKAILFRKGFPLSDLESEYKKKTGKGIMKATVLGEKRGERYVFYLIPHGPAAVTVRPGFPVEKFFYDRKKRKAGSIGVKTVSAR